jgi:indole-3-glycerol phosphate synthase
MTSVLDSIIQGVKEDLEVRKTSVSLSELKSLVNEVPRALPAAELLHKNSFSVISEVKRASPSKGHLSDIPDPASLALEYQTGGAQVISVLTEQRKFNGNLADLDAVRRKVSIPILRKDFMVDEYQVWEARAHGADVILLIVAGLSDSQLSELNELAIEVGMSVLVEIHDAPELDRALAINPKLLGVNARNLKTLEVSLDVCHNLIPHIPEHILAIAESGISTTDQVEALVLSGARAVLVGEALVTGGTPAKTVAEWTKAGIQARDKFLLNRS